MVIIIIIMYLLYKAHFPSQGTDQMTLQQVQSPTQIKKNSAGIGYTKQMSFQACFKRFQVQGGCHEQRQFVP